MIGDFLHSYRENGRDLADRGQGANILLEPGAESCCTLLTGEAAIPATSAKHLFRTPSLGGQAGGRSTNLPAVFSCCARAQGHGRRLAHQSALSKGCLSQSCGAVFLSASEVQKKRETDQCGQQESGLYVRALVVWPPVATRSESRRLSAARSARARRRFWTAMLPLGRPLARRATCFTARKTRTSADPNHILLTGAGPRSTQNYTTDTVRRDGFARGVSCAPYPKTKDVPCSTRS